MAIHVLKYTRELVFREVTKPVQSRRLTMGDEGQNEPLGKQGSQVLSEGGAEQAGRSACEVCGCE